MCCYLPESLPQSLVKAWGWLHSLCHISLNILSFFQRFGEIVHYNCGLLSLPTLWTAANIKTQTSNQGNWQSHSRQWQREQRSNWQSLPAAGLNQWCRYAVQDSYRSSFSKENKGGEKNKSTLSNSKLIKEAAVSFSWLEDFCFATAEAQQEK